MISRQLTLINKLGLHARAANKLLDVTCRFESDITLSFNGKDADGKSIMSVMMLAAPVGSVLDVVVEGPDEQALLNAVEQLVANRFDEDE